MTIISYRPPLSDSACFLNIEGLLQSKNSKKIRKVYESIYLSVTAYEPEYVDHLIKLEKSLHQRLQFLNAAKKEKLEAKLAKWMGWKKIAISILTLGIGLLVLTGRKYLLQRKLKRIEKAIEEIDKSHIKFSKRHAQMNQRRMPKELHDKPEAIIELESLHLSDLVEELERLKAIPRIARSLERVQAFSIHHQVAFGRSCELQERLKATHYVINHGQGLKFMLVNIIARKLKQEFEAERYESFESLRHNVVLREIEKATDHVAWYQHQISMEGMSDHQFRNELISGDCVLESDALGESALSFFEAGANVATYLNPSLGDEFIQTILQDYFPDEAAQSICSDLIKIMENCSCGANLYSICVPKEKFDESCYFSKPVGVPFSPELARHFRACMAELQAGTMQDLEVIPQIRILTNKIRAEDGFYVVLNSTLSRDEIHRIEEGVALNLQAALLGYRLETNSLKKCQLP